MQSSFIEKPLNKRSRSMFRRLSPVIGAAFLVSFTAFNANAQFNNGNNCLGAHVGLSGVGSALTLGLDYERAVTEPGKAGPGIIGIGGLFDYYHWSEDFFGYGGSWTYIDLGVSGMYHFIIPGNRKIDPFVGLVLGYEIATWSWSSSMSGYGFSNPTAGGFTLGGSAGIRYFLSDQWALQARVGFGFYLFAVGIDYKF
jgi:hypothetical protein